MQDYILKDGCLYHYGIMGQKWGVRRYQNEDGSLTPEGYAHYGYKGPLTNKNRFRAATKKLYDSKSDYKSKNISKKEYTSAKKEYKESKAAYKNDTELRKAEQDIWKQQRRDYIATKSIGERIATGLTLGPAGLYNYNSLMASGSESKLGAWGASVVANFLGGPIGNIAYSSIIGSREKNNY